METGTDTSGFQGFKLFGTTIPMDSTQGKENGKGFDTPEKRCDKALPCPRCKSMETKFCYFNNYNVNQPRHFCKGCQRYWTAGGTLRNVPFGAGRRKTRPTCHDPIRISGDCTFDPSEVKELGLEGVLDYWHVSTSRTSKRRNHSLKTRPDSPELPRLGKLP